MGGPAYGKHLPQLICFPLQPSPPLVASIPHVGHLHFQQIPHAPTPPPSWIRLSPGRRGSTSVRVCQRRSLAKRSHKYSPAKYLRPRPGDCVAGQMWESSGSAALLYLPRLSVNRRSNLSGRDGCDGAGSILPLTHNQGDFNLIRMNQHLPRAQTNVSK